MTNIESNAPAAVVPQEHPTAALAAVLDPASTAAGLLRLSAGSLEHILCVVSSQFPGSLRFADDALQDIHFT